MRMTVVERAYELAGEGQCRSVSDIAIKLKREQFSSVDAHLSGSLIKKSLNALIREAQARRAQASSSDTMHLEPAQ